MDTETYPLGLGEREAARRERDARGRGQAEAREREVVEPVLGEHALDRRQLLRRHVCDDEMLVRRHPERALVHLRDLAQARLEVAPGLVLHAAVLDEAREVVPPVLARRPPEVVDVLLECVRPRGRELVAQSPLDFGLVVLKTHAVDGVLETSVLNEVKVG